MATITTAAEPAPQETVRLCLASQAFYPVYAGPAIRFGRYLPGFASRGVDVRVFTATPSAVKASMSNLQSDGPHAQPGEMLPVETVKGVPLHRVRLPDSGGLRRSMLFSEKLVSHCRQPDFRPDVVQLLSLSFTSIPALRKLRRLGIPTIFTRTMLPEQGANPLKQALVQRYLTFPSRLVSCTVVSSGLMRDEMLELGVRSRIEVISNGVDTHRFRPASGTSGRMAVRRPLGIAEDDTVLLFVGPVSPRKGIDLLLKAWCNLAPIFGKLHLVIVGPRRDESDPAQVEFAHKLEALIAASGAPERVHFVGLVENVEEYMRAADVFAFTSRREGMPNVVPEAMASGLPVVTTPFIGLPSEFGAPGRQYLLSDFTPEAIAARIAELVRDPGLGRTFGAAARAWVEEGMAVATSLDRYVALYRELALESTRNGANR